MMPKESHPMKKVRSVGAFEACRRARSKSIGSKSIGLAAEFSLGLGSAATSASGRWNRQYQKFSCGSFEEDYDDSPTDGSYEELVTPSPLRKVSSWSGPEPMKKRGCLQSYAAQEETEAENASFSLKDLPRFLAKVSVVILALAAMADLTSQSSQSSAFRSSSSAKRPALGSAAITSVTETLSPILPFTGGIDLRKEDYWTSSSPWESFQYITQQVWEAFAASDGPDSSARNFGNTNSKPNGSVKRTISRSNSISASECFAPLKDIGELTLEDVATVVRFATQSNRLGFDEQRFIGKQAPRVRKVLAALNKAVQASRGDGVEISVGPSMERKQVSKQAPGSMDALMFAGAMRIFGEWRVVRQVPDGYKGYAVGMNLGSKDITQNVAKVEAAVHGWLDMKHDLPGHVMRSPTLAQLMQYEAESGLHPSLPRLKDRTGAMGLLWVRRQLQYQSQVFENIMQTERFPTTKEAVSAAYDKVYNQYHGWAVQKIFTYSFQGAPVVDAVYRHMNPHKLKELRESKVPLTEIKMEEQNKESEKQNNLQTEENPIVMWFKNLEKELDANPVIGWFKKVGNDTRRLVEEVREKLLPDDKISASVSTSAMEDYISREMAKDARENMVVFLDTAKPLLDDLAAAFKQFNMDDPTKV